VTDLPEDYADQYADTAQVAEDTYTAEEEAPADREESKEDFEAVYFDGPDPDGSIAAVYEYCNIAMDRRAKKIRERYHASLHDTLLGQMRIADRERRQRYTLLV
jgi:hypothetical protein